MKTAERIIAFFLLFFACLVWPIIGIANRPVVVLGIPALVLYLFTLWAVLVTVLVLIARPWRPFPGRAAEDEL